MDCKIGNYILLRINKTEGKHTTPELKNSGLEIHDTLDDSFLRKYFQIKRFVKSSNKEKRDLISVEFLI